MFSVPTCVGRVFLNVKWSAEGSIVSPCSLSVSVCVNLNVCLPGSHYVQITWPNLHSVCFMIFETDNH